MFSYIILRDIPKEAVQLDLTTFEVHGGFRGFALVPRGPHFLRVNDGGDMVGGTWLFLLDNDAVVRVYDSATQTFARDTPENEAHYRNLALGGAMNKVLVPVMALDTEFASRWTKIVKHVGSDAFPPVLHAEEPMYPPADPRGPALAEFMQAKFQSRIEQAFLGTHQGDVQSFLAEFEFAFASWVVGVGDDQAGERWRHLLQATYNAGDHFMADYPDLFAPLVDVIIAQCETLGGDAFAPNSAVTHGAKYLAEDLVDTGIALLVDKGHAFERFIHSKGIT